MLIEKTFSINFGFSSANNLHEARISKMKIHRVNTLLSLVLISSIVNALLAYLHFNRILDLWLLDMTA